MATLGLEQSNDRAEIIIFSAASTYLPLTKAIEAYKKVQPDIRIRSSFGASAILARQINNGAPADVFLSANLHWISWLEKKSIIQEKPTSIAQNQLLFVNNKMNPNVQNHKTSCLEYIKNALKNPIERLIIADPDISPLGKYSKEALIGSGLWKDMKTTKIVTGNATMALKLVELKTAEYGIIYASSAKTSNNVNWSCIIPPESHSKINYYISEIGQGQKHVRKFLHFLKAQKQIWINTGFTIKLPHNDT